MLEDRWAPPKSSKIVVDSWGEQWNSQTSMPVDKQRQVKGAHVEVMAALPADRRGGNPGARRPPTGRQRLIHNRHRPRQDSEEAMATPKAKRRRRAGPLSADTATLNLRELDHMIHFFLCQMRAQCDRRLGSTYATNFDKEMARLDPERGSRDVVAQDHLMAEFFAKAARGDKWVPWHTVLGTHESYLHERVYSHHNISEADRFVLMFAFSGSREIPLFDSLFQPLIRRANAGEPTAVVELHALLHQPAETLKRGGDWHQKYIKYRAAGNRLHTTCYTIHPPAGCSGDEFTFFIVDHTRRYIELGQHIWKLVDPQQQQLNRLPSPTLQQLAAVLQAHKGVGPTLTKMFLVSIHLWRPDMQLLAKGCPVGDGAKAAFAFLYGDTSAERCDSQALLLKLHAILLADAPTREPRLLPMVKWCARQARKSRYCDKDCAPALEEETTAMQPDGFPSDAFSEELSVYDLQVNLCEWRAFSGWNRC
eukprot:COSAG02_NODE_4199_length_5633_cov_4.504518_7_plen_479_part_00